MDQYILLVSGWIAYFFLHSLLASNRIKTLFKSKQTYRLLYSMLSIFGLITLLFLSGSIKSAYFFPNEGAVRYLSLVSTAFGVIVIQLAFRQYSLKAFLGLEQEKDEPLQVEGILKSVRHPIYSGIILIVIGFFVFIPNMATLISSLCILAYLPIGINLEERKLIAQYGETYLRYKNQVPALIPRTIKF